MAQLLVVGSVNYDLIMLTPRLPEAGESLIGATFYESCGGKGSNQAVVAARAAKILGGPGLEVAFCGAIGDDAFGAAQKAAMSIEGIDLEHLFVLAEARTGTASVWVEEETGQNRILSAPGANDYLLPERLAAVDLEKADLVLVPNEIPPETIRSVAARCAKAQVPLMWNPAPFPRGMKAFFPLDQVETLTPNEVEAAGLLGRDFDVADPAAVRKAALELQSSGPRTVAITLGERGVEVASEGAGFRVPAPVVEVVDTTGAGDAFNGAMAAARLAGYELQAAIEFGVRYASASVTAPGTQTSYPREL